MRFVLTVRQHRLNPAFALSTSITLPTCHQSVSKWCVRVIRSLITYANMEYQGCYSMPIFSVNPSSSVAIRTSQPVTVISLANVIVPVVGPVRPVSFGREPNIES